MMIGHAALAFIIVTLIASYMGYTGKRLLLIGIGGMFFATLPDVDMVYAFLITTIDLVSVGFGFDQAGLVSTFWGSSHEVHRKVTHSIAFGTIFSLLFALTAVGYRHYSKSHRNLYRRIVVSGHIEVFVGVSVLALIATTYIISGFIGAGVLFIFSLVGIIGTILWARLGFSPKEIGGISLVGLVSHPFGDIFTGTPPNLFYPFNARLFPDSAIVIIPEPTLNLLSIFLLELLIIGFALCLFFDLNNIKKNDYITGYSILAVLYGFTVLFFTPPTLDVSYHIVLSIVGLGILIGGLSMAFKDRDLQERVLLFTSNSFISIIFAVLSYSVSYITIFIV